MYTFIDDKLKPNDLEGLFAQIQVLKNGKFETYIHVWETLSKKGFQVHMANGVKSTTYKFDTIDEAVSFAKSYYDPFQDAIDRINKMVDKRVAEARHTLHLRMAEFRGTLFKYGTWLKANNIHIDDLALVGSKVLCISDNNYNAYRRYHFPNKGKVYTIASYINLPRGKGITLEEIDFPIIAVNNRTTPKEYTPMNAPFLYSRFKPL